MLKKQLKQNCLIGLEVKVLFANATTSKLQKFHRSSLAIVLVIPSQNTYKNDVFERKVLSLREGPLHFMDSLCNFKGLHLLVVLSVLGLHPLLAD